MFIKQRFVLQSLLLITAVLMLPPPAVPAQQTNQASIIKEIRHELATLPYYGVFDWLQFEVSPDNRVTLSGQVVRPSTRADAEREVGRIDGVRSVDNQIEVLPVSSHDDRLRIAIYRTIYGWNSPLFRYAHQRVPSIHIIVNRGRVTLKGVVDSTGDAQIAYIRARGVSGAFEVRNELQTARERAR